MTCPLVATPLAAASLDRPWHRPGALRYALGRVRGILRPPVTVQVPDPDSVVTMRDVPVRMRDGVALRVNVYLPRGEGRHPVILAAHPYGKDRLPRRRGQRSRFSMQYRVMRQPQPVAFSTMTTWEAPDPAWWTAHGYVVVNADLRGSGTSDGVGALMSDGEAGDVYDLIEWAGRQAWSTGAVGMLGVSYLAMAQYKAAALTPPSLKAICPWEGMTDAYRDLMRPGGLYEHGFTRIWAAGTKRQNRLAVDLGREQRERPLRDQWWQSLVPHLAQITVPMLVCGSFSDDNLHTRGSFRAFEQAGSAQRYLYTHRGGKWATFYGEDARAAQLAFFERFLRGRDVAAPPRVRLEVRESRDEIAAVREEEEWPLARTEWMPLYLSDSGRLDVEAPTGAGKITFAARRRAASFTYTFPEDVELTGSMALHLWLSVDRADDVDLVAGAEKWRGRQYVGFEGSYGFGRDRVATGWQKASLRRLDDATSSPARPVHTFLTRQPLTAGEVVPVDVALGPSATVFRAGESLRLVVGGRWLWPANPLTGQFPRPIRAHAICRVHPALGTRTARAPAGAAHSVGAPRAAARPALPLPPRPSAEGTTGGIRPHPVLWWQRLAQPEDRHGAWIDIDRLGVPASTRPGCGRTKEHPMRYGMNPHQKARVAGGTGPAIRNGEPSLINYLDALNAYALVREADEATGTPAAASFKHVSPAGAALAGPVDDVAAQLWRVDAAPDSLLSAYVRARDADPKSSFGDVVALSRPVDLDTARFLRTVISDAVIAPGYEPGTIEELAQKKGGRFLILEADPAASVPQTERREVQGLVLEQDVDAAPVAAALPDDGTLAASVRADALLGMVALRYTQSNSIVLVKDGSAVGIGAGQQNRVDCVRLAGSKADVWWLRRHRLVRELPQVEGMKRQDRLNWQIRFAGREMTAHQLQAFAELFGADAAAQYIDDTWRQEWLDAFTDVTLTSDGYLPFADNVEHAAIHGVTTIVEPGGSTRTPEVAAAAAELGIAHVQTGLRLFHH